MQVYRKSPCCSLNTVAIETLAQRLVRFWQRCMSVLRETMVPGQKRSTLLQRRCVLLVLFLIGILHVTVLLTSQRYADGDESVIGVMTLHILTRNAHPLFFYGQVYGTGAALESYLATIPFTLFGISSLTLKCVALLLFWAALASAYSITRLYLDNRAALWMVILLGVATPLIEWRTKMRGGYAGIPFFTLIILLIYGRILEQDQKPWWRYLLLGVAMGGALFNSTLSLSLLVAIFIHSLFVARRFYRWSVLLLPLGVMLSLMPLIVHEVRTDYMYVRYLLSLGGTPLTMDDVGNVIIHYLPRFFVSRNVDAYVSQVSVLGWVEFGVYALVFVSSIFFLGVMPASPKKRILSASILVVLSHLVFFTISREKGFSPRYLLPICAPLLFIVVMMRDYIGSKFAKSGIRWVPHTIMALLILIGVYNNLTYIHSPTVTDDVLLTDGRIVNVQTDGLLAQRLIELFKTQGITYVRTGYFLQWRILFESKEAIIASSEGYFPTVSRFAAYDNLVATADRVAFVQHKDSMYLQQIEQNDSARAMRRFVLDDYVVFIP
jgi:4-amino-4-deoxy-L-arabinose transferase-like glycosyltransferase